MPRFRQSLAGRRRGPGWGTGTVVATVMAAQAVAAEPVRLVTGNGYAPLSDEDWLNGGLVTDVVRQVYAQLDRRVTIDFLPWVRGAQATRAGRYRATFPYIHNAERERRYFFSKPVIRTEKRPMTLAGSGLRAETVGELAGLTYCMPHGYPPQAAIARLTERGRLRRLDPPSMRACVKTLAEGYADFIPVSTLQGRAVADAVLPEGRKVRFLEIVLQCNGQHVIFPRGQPGAEKARDRFDRGLAALKRSGRHQEIVARHIRRLREVASNGD
ncbi:polar amino acid transport system substrate-binding protein [Limimonas halophila]|uniref:Polar amino acid transport system substrate-binding protein n=1 Tax=Limimonas halophila TaxID=1082479 RepID=A0A1G7PTV5_9PROT|nr:ABC transporter substrate-binding protein [Limimonas halophila]SDF89665.1 polar amino acid transport system substrate-binding protein [Limimonas halophila]